MTWAALFLALSLLVTGESARARVRLGVPSPTPARPDAVGNADGDPLAAASSFDVLAACLSSGMAVSTAAAATAPSAPPQLAQVLWHAADLLALGADPAIAWSNPAGALDKHVDALLRLARRSASSGAALAQAVSELAAESRQDAADTAGAAAERAAVLIAAPLGLCYLPAFLCLGIIPVVAGLAGKVLQSGLI